MNGWHDITGMPVAPGALFGLMGIVNVTPDSFFDGAKHNTPEAAASQAAALLEAGAAIIDIGAESTRPGAITIDAETEIARLLPSLDAVRAANPGSVISVDTRKARVAAAAIEHGASIVNDVSGLGHDPAMLETLAAYRPGYVLTHSAGEPENMQRNPQYKNVLDSVKFFFERGLTILSAAGIPENRIILDPGIGFGKTHVQNMSLLRNIETFMVFGRPLLVGLSMKSMFGKFGLEVSDRTEATAIAIALLMQKGVQWHRAHHVASARMACSLALALGAQDNS